MVCWIQYIFIIIGGQNPGLNWTLNLFGETYYQNTNSPERKLIIAKLKVCRLL